MLSIATTIAAYFSCLLLLVWALSPIKKQKNARTQKNTQKPKLLRFQRGHKALTPGQNEELHKIQHQNFTALKHRFKNEHL